MTISAKVIADSVSPDGIKMRTLEIKHPRFVHSEFMTHRQLSKNAASSRAIPFKKMIERIKNDMAMPVYWGANKPGMQAAEELTGAKLAAAKLLWVSTGYVVMALASIGNKLGLHKQIVNRMIEPWSYITVVVSATEWNNFFALRAHKDAQPEIQELAHQMAIAMAGSEPKELQPGEWHLPYFTDADEQKIKDAFVIKNDDGIETGVRHLVKSEGVEYTINDCRLLVSAAKCARVSYLNHDGKATTLGEDLKLASRLLHAEPAHLSPFEHQATPDVWLSPDLYSDVDFPHWENDQQHANLVGWRQARHVLVGK